MYYVDDYQFDCIQDALLFADTVVGAGATIEKRGKPIITLEPDGYVIYDMDDDAWLEIIAYENKKDTIE